MKKANILTPKTENIGEYYFHLGGVPLDKIEDCMRWAFGEEIDIDTPLGALKDGWNKLHNDIFVIEGHEPIALCLVAIGKAYTLRWVK